MITVYTEVLKQAAKDDDGLIDGDEEVIEDNFADYVDWLERTLFKKFGEDQVYFNENSGAWGPCYQVDEHGIKKAGLSKEDVDVPGFWEWFN